MLVKSFEKSSLYLLLIPLLYLLLYGYLMSLNGPFYLTRIDPDYVYLLNGMNCSIFHFDRIGHLDHPGTPFQVFLGICIDMIYFFSGKESIISDVLSRPEHYLAWCSDMLAVLMFLTMVWAGKIGKKYSGWLGAFILQLSPFLSPILLDLSVRIMADRFAMTLVFILMILLIKWLSISARAKKQVVLMGILSGIILATKISFIPVFIFPLLLVKERILLVVTTILGFFLGILPILNRTSDFSAFIAKLISHDGIYGSGAKQFIDHHVFLRNIWLIIQSNALLIAILVFCLVYGLLDLAKKKSIWQGHNIFQLAFSVAAVFSILLVAKHYKNYYIAPILMTMGSCLWVITQRGNSKLLSYSILLVAVCFSYLSIAKEVNATQHKSQIITNRVKAAEEVKILRSSDSYFIIKPEWLWGLTREYGLIFGLSYVRHRFLYQSPIDEMYSRTLSYEGPEQNFRKMRLAEISDSTLIEEGRVFYLIDQKGRNAKEIISDLHERLQYYSVDSFRLSNDDLIYQLEPQSSKH